MRKYVIKNKQLQVTTWSDNYLEAVVKFKQKYFEKFGISDCSNVGYKIYCYC